MLKSINLLIGTTKKTENNVESVMSDKAIIQLYLDDNKITIATAKE